MSKNDFQDFKKPEELNGKTIVSCEIILSEHARTADNYLLLRFQNGKRQLLGITGFSFWEPEPTVEEMRKAPSFFTVEDILKRVEHDENKIRANAYAAHRQLLSEYERLKKIFGKDE